MNARRGACPALSAPMQTGDGLLIRLSPVLGGLSPKQLIELCESAARLGNGTIEVTARGSLQFRGFSERAATEFAAEVDALGIAVRAGVSVETSPLAGLDPTEIADPTPLANAIRSRIAGAGLAKRLGPKVSVVIDGGGQVPMNTIAADVRLAAIKQADGIAWAIALAGDAAAAKPLGSHDAVAAIDMVLAIFSEIAALGPEARGRDLVSSLFSSQLSSHAPFVRGNPGTADAVEPNVNSAFAPIRLKDSYFALPVAFPFGHTDAAALFALTRRSEALEITEIRPAPDRRLLFICPTQAAAAELQSAAAELGFVTDPGDIRARIAACPGAPACASGHIAARALAQELATALAGRSGADLSFHISGCEKGCAQQAAADITIVGGENGAGLVVHGTTRMTPLAYTTQDRLPQAIATVAALLQEIPATAPRPDHARLAKAFEQGRT